MVQAATNEMKHYWNGCRIIYQNRKLAKDMQLKTTKTRYEVLFIRRTNRDLKIVLPFLFYIFVVPFSFTALPFLIYMFPDSLPSTFWKASQYLQRNIGINEKRKNLSRELLIIILKDIKYNNVFHQFNEPGFLSINEFKYYINNYKLTFDDKNRIQLKLASSYFSMFNSFLPNSIIVKNLNNYINMLRNDDIQLEKELKSLKEEELKEACIERGLPSLDVSIPMMINLLESWLYLSLKENVINYNLILFSIIQSSNIHNFT